LIVLPAFQGVHGKGRGTKDEFVLLTPACLEPIRGYLGRRGEVTDENPLFTSLSGRNRRGRLTTRSVRRIVRLALLRIGLRSKRISAHSLRHTAVTLALIGGASVQEASTFARHSSINTTMIYAHNVDRIASAPERKIDALLDLDGA
jgi:integrase/recombinase XerC/integrase/recombinase XerD